MDLRTTPSHFRGRDRDLFPALEQVQQRHGVPANYRVKAHPRWVSIHVWDFYVEEIIRARIERLYEQYADWLFDPHNPARRVMHGIGIPAFRGDIILEVLREHALWWIDLFNEAAPFIEERARLFPDRHDEGEQTDREREHPDVLREEAEAKEQKHREWEQAQDRKYAALEAKQEERAARARVRRQAPAMSR